MTPGLKPNTVKKSCSNRDKRKGKQETKYFVLHFVMQMEQFRQLKADHGKFPNLMCDNNRPLQPLKGRTVYSVNEQNINNNSN